MKITGADVIVRCLIANGITDAFNIPGLGIAPLLDAFKRNRDAIKYYTGPSETAIGLMADGYGRATGRPSFVNVYHASGTALAMVGVTTAWADRSPMIFTSTTAAIAFERSDSYAAVPRAITEMSRQFTKWDWEVPSVARIPEAIARAVLIASTPPMGPVHLAFPMDLYTTEVDESVITDAIMAQPDRLNLYRLMTADADGISEAARLLSRAKRPIIVAGSEVRQFGAIDALRRIAEQTGAAVFAEPCVSSFLGFPNTHPQSMGKFSPRLPIVQAADLIVSAYADFPEATGAVAPPSTPTLISMAASVDDIGKQIWADVGLTGHPRPTLDALADAVAGHDQADRAEWMDQQLGYAKQLRQSYAGFIEDGWDAGPVSIPRLMHEIDQAFGNDAVIVDHSSTASPYIVEMTDLSDPYRYLGISGRASAQGWGAPASIGIQIGSPDRRVIAIVGDGGFMFTGSNIYAAAQWQTNNIFVVLNNTGWHDVCYQYKNWSDWDDGEIADFGLWQSPAINFSDFAKSLGLNGYRASNPEELIDALKNAKSTSGPVLIEVMSNPNAIDNYFDWVSR